MKHPVLHQADTGRGGAEDAIEPRLAVAERELGTGTLDRDAEDLSEALNRREVFVRVVTRCIRQSDLAGQLVAEEHGDGKGNRSRAIWPAGVPWAARCSLGALV